MKDAYKKLQAKYRLPEFERMNEEYELYVIEHEDYLLKSIAKRMLEKLEGYAKFIDEIFHPEANIAVMRMASALEAEDKRALNRIYGRLQYWSMSGSEVDLAYDEKKTAKYIGDLHLEWQGMKKDLLRILLKLRDSWMSEKKERTDTGYLG